MSLLLNALKKAEAGDSPEEAKPAAEGGPEHPVKTGSEPSGSVVDFDTIPDDNAKDGGGSGTAVGGGVGEGRQKKARVDAARVFSANENEGYSAGRGKKFIAGVLGVVFVAGGGYGVLVSEVIPGFNVSALKGIVGGGDSLSTTVASSADFEVGGVSVLQADDQLLLPIPVVDVQSEVDFSDLRLPQNSSSVIGEEEYKRKIATYTGYDIDKELQKLYKDSRSPQQDFEEVSDVYESDDFVEEESKVKIVRTAEVSRERKLRIDAITASDSYLNVVIKGDSVNSEITEEKAPSAAAKTSKESAIVAQIEVSAEGVKRNAKIEKAKHFYYSGSYTEAEAIYREVLRSAPTNKDALRGIAQVAVATRRYRLAAATYLEILGYYPDDPVAVTELINFRGNDGNFYETEKILKGLIGKFPKLDGRVYFALGNLYAGNGRLYDAQQAYFDAYNREMSNPDYAYNLAVILDHLNKPALSIGYYRQSLTLSDGVLVGFNRADVERRVDEIEKAEGE